MVFTATCRGCYLLSLLMEELHIPAAALHSHLTQGRRLASLEKCALTFQGVVQMPAVGLFMRWHCATGRLLLHRCGLVLQAAVWCSQCLWQSVYRRCHALESTSELLGLSDALCAGSSRGRCLSWSPRMWQAGAWTFPRWISS